MNGTSSGDPAQYIRDRYRDRTARSLALHNDAKAFLPGGDTRTINHFAPYPTFMATGAGNVLTDVDGNTYLDFYNNMSATVHGHGHPALVAAAAGQFVDGTALGTPIEVQLRHAQSLQQRVPSMQKIRYCNSGTEATMMALRAARAFTGRSLIAKIDGGYHGLHNDVEVNMFAGLPGPSYPQPGLPDSFPSAQPARGVPIGVLKDVAVLPYNDLTAARELLRLRGSELAALIVEPMMGAAGGIPGDPDYLRGLRQLTQEQGVLLIFDECATFRLGPLQTRYGITPDLTTLSKIIGGGLPMGAFGGRADVMNLFDPARTDPLYHAGAFAGNNLGLAVGAVALDTFGVNEVQRLNTLGDRMIRDITTVARDAGVALEATGIGSLAHLHWGTGLIVDAQDALTRRIGLADLPELLHLEMLNRGIYLSRRGLLSLNLLTTDGDMDAFLTALHETLTLLRPYVMRHVPQLSIDAVATR